MSWQASKRVSHWLFSEWQKKLVAIAVATLAWFYVHRLSQVEENFTVPLQYKNLPQGMVILDSEPDARLVVKGKREQLKKLNIQKAIRASVDLSEATNGVDSYKIELVINDAQPDLNFHLTSDQVKVRTDYVIQKTVEIRPQVVGNLLNGYSMEMEVAEKKDVTLVGPLSVLTQVSEIVTRPVSIEGFSNDMMMPLDLVLPRATSQLNDEKYLLILKIRPLEEAGE